MKNCELAKKKNALPVLGAVAVVLAAAGALMCLVCKYHQTLKCLLTSDDDDFFDVDDLEDAD